MRTGYKIACGTIAALIVILMVVMFRYLTRTCTVTFHSGIGEVNIASVQVKPGETVGLESPEVPGKIFGGWYLNGELFNERTQIYDDITLDATWIDAIYEGIEEIPEVEDIQKTEEIQKTEVIQPTKKTQVIEDAREIDGIKEIGEDENIQKIEATQEVEKELPQEE